MPRFRTTYYRRQAQPALTDQNWNELTVAQAIEKTIATTTCTKNTIKAWRVTANRAAALLPKTIAELCTADLRNYQQKRIKDGAARSTVRGETATILAAIHRARPELSVELVKRDHNERTGIALTEEEITRLLEATRPWGDLHLAVRLGLCGLRISEILELRVKDWNAETNTLLIEKSKTRAGIRRIPITEPDTIEALAYQTKSGEPDQPMFPGTDPRKPRVTFERTWAEARRAAHLTKIIFHDLRHTAITRLCEAGVPDWTIRAYVGHVSEQMMKIYSHPRGEALKQAAAALARKEGKRAKQKQPRCEKQHSSSTSAATATAQRP